MLPGAAPDELAALLARACTALEHRADFSRHLLSARVYAPGERRGRGYALQRWQRQDDSSEVIPFFSTPALLEQALNAPTPFVRLSGRALFRHAGDTPLILNPLSDTNKEFPAAEARLLRLRAAASVLLYGDDMPGKPEAHLLVGVPDPLPVHFLRTLTDRVSVYATVEAVHAVSTFQPDSGNGTDRLLLALLAPDPVPDLCADLEIELAPLLPERVPVDVVWLEEDHPLSAYILNETSPVYQRGWKGQVGRTVRHLVDTATGRA